jgi:hypothetical protein
VTKPVSSTWRLHLGVCLLLILATASVNVFGASAPNLRCGSRLVNVGDSSSRLIDYCGQPTNVEKNETRTPVETWDQQLQKNVTTYEIQPYQVWKYNFGRSRLTSNITIQNGTVQKIDTGGYGW